MTLQQLRQFVTIAETASFTRAALILGMAQPALSQALQRLEREVGVRLVERSRTGVSLSPAGAAFLQDAREALAAAHRAPIRAREAADPRSPVRIGMVSSAIWGALSDFLRVANEQEIPTELFSIGTNEQLDAIERGELSFGFVTPPLRRAMRLTVLPVADDPVVAAVPSEWIRDEQTVPLSRIADSLILFPRDDGPVLHDALMSMFAAAGLSPRIVQRSPRMLATLSLVASGIGAAFVPKGIAKAVSVAGVTFRPVGAVAVPPWPLALVHLALMASSPAARLLRAWKHKTGTKEMSA